MSPFMVWLQLYRVEIALALAGLFAVALIFVLWLFGRGGRHARQQQRNQVPPLDQALMELSSDELRTRGVLRSTKETDQ